MKHQIPVPPPPVPRLKPRKAVLSLTTSFTTRHSCDSPVAVTVLVLQLDDITALDGDVVLPVPGTLSQGPVSAWSLGEDQHHSQATAREGDHRKGSTVDI